MATSLKKGAKKAKGTKRKSPPYPLVGDAAYALASSPIYPLAKSPIYPLNKASKKSGSG